MRIGAVNGDGPSYHLNFIANLRQRQISANSHHLLVIVPVCSLILAVFLAHAFIGPVGRMIGDGVAWAVRHLLTGSFAPIGAALFGFLYAPLVITGVHQTTLAIDMQMIQDRKSTRLNSSHRL